LQFGNSKPLLGGYAALMLKFVLRLWTPRSRANPRPMQSGSSYKPFQLSASPHHCRSKKSRSIRTGSMQRGSCDIQLLHVSGNPVEGVVLALAVDFGLGFPMPDDDDRESHGLGPGFGRFLCAICAE
jgi:hypothetical protein